MSEVREFGGGPITIYMNIELLDDLDFFCKQKGMSRSKVVKEILTDFFHKEE